MKYWKQEQLIGFSVKDLKEVKRVSKIKGINMVEIRLSSFAERGMTLYEFKEGIFIPCPDNLARVKKITQKKLKVQFHLPFENQIDPAQERGLSMAISEHHPFLLQRFEMFNQILIDYGLGETLTIHPPQIVAKGKKIATFTEALKSANSFFWSLDQEILKRIGGFLWP